MNGFVCYYCCPKSSSHPFNSCVHDECHLKCYLSPCSYCVPSMLVQIKCSKLIIKVYFVCSFTCPTHQGSLSDLWGKQFCLSAFLTHPGKISTTEAVFKQYSLLICYFSSQTWAMPHYLPYTVTAFGSVRKKIEGKKCSSYSCSAANRELIELI